MSKRTKLRPCPLCGGTVSIVLMDAGLIGHEDDERYWMITRGAADDGKDPCECRLFMESRLFRSDDDEDGKRAKEELIEAWNRRVDK